MVGRTRARPVFGWWIMKKLCVYTLFESDGGRPRSVGVKSGDRVQIFDLYRPGSRVPVKNVWDNIEFVNNLILEAGRRGIAVVTSDFKNHIRAFNLPLDRHYDAYDLHLPDIKPCQSLAKDGELLKKILDKLAAYKVKPYQKILANAAVAYQGLENRGVLHNYELVFPKWHLKGKTGRAQANGSFAGRSTIQNFKEHHFIGPPGSTERDVLIHFDWISADMLVASLVSGDKKLQAAFNDSDPYAVMMAELNVGAKEPLTRKECKELLLQSINSFDVDSAALSGVFPDLGRWIIKCRKILAEPNGYLDTMLGRRFRLSNCTSRRAVLNGVMQGTVAHAMQIVIRKVWDHFGIGLVCDNHDSIIMSSPADNTAVNTIVKGVAEFMLHPFAGVLPENPVFPFKVSIGKKWRKWKLRRIYRASGVEYVTDERAQAEDAAEGGGEEEAAAEETTGGEGVQGEGVEG